MPESWPITAPTFGTYEWFQQSIGKELPELGPNFNGWDHAQTSMVHSLINQGLQQFYHPAISVAPGHRKHRWSFMKQEADLTTNAPYSTGTVTIAAGVVTLTVAGTFPSWAAAGEVVVGGVRYTVNTRDGDNQVTLDDTSVTAAAGSAYSIEQRDYVLPSDFYGMLGTIKCRPGSTSYYRPIEPRNPQWIRENIQRSEFAAIPRCYTIQHAATDATAVTSRLVRFWPPPDAAYRLTYLYRTNPADLAATQYPLGGRDHVNTQLMSMLAIHDPMKYRDRFLECLAASSDSDQANMGPERFGLNLDASEGDMEGFSRQTNDPIQFAGVTYD